MLVRGGPRQRLALDRALRNLPCPRWHAAVGPTPSRTRHGSANVLVIQRTQICCQRHMSLGCDSNRHSYAHGTPDPLPPEYVAAEWRNSRCLFVALDSRGN